MGKNIFEELQDKKSKLMNLANKAHEFGWIDELRKKEIIDKLESDTLTIGVIGQMKCGKSTFLNSFVFQDSVLPAATTPMTAALSIITYGEKERIVAEFYSTDEWEEQKMQASRSLDEVAGNTIEESKIKAAKELVSKSSKLGSSLQQYLGQTKEDSFNNLIEYVGADGKYISITKSVTIYYPKEYLKGVEIVDTPGFNDPIVSREERTKEFLKKADVVLMMLYAGRPFDATDRDIIFKNVRQCGIGKVLVGINKYDIPYCSDTNPEDENQIKDYVKAEIRKACKECNDNTLVEILSEVEPIPLSAEMALLSELPMSKITSDEAFNFAWKRHCKNFGIGSQTEMKEYSHLDDLVNAVKNMIDKEKGKILFAKPINSICAAGDKIKMETETEINKTSSEIEVLKMPDDELDEREDNLSKANKRFNKKINSLGDDLDAEIQNLVRKGKNELEDLVDASCTKMRGIIDNEWSRFKSADSIIPRLNSELQTLCTRNLKRASENLATDGKKKIQQNIADFFNDAEELLMRYLPEFDSREFVKSTQQKIHMDMEETDLFSFSEADGNEDYGWLNVFGEVVNGILTGATFGIWNVAFNALTHDEDKRDALEWVNSVKAEFDPSPYLDSAFHSKEQVIDSVKQTFISDLIEPLQSQLEEIKTEKGNKEKKITEAESKLKQLALSKDNILNQLKEMESLKALLA